MDSKLINLSEGMCVEQHLPGEMGKNMTTRTVRMLILVLAIWVVVQTAPLVAQTTFTSPFAITGTGGSGFQFGADGTLMVNGASGEGVRGANSLLYLSPSLGSFAAGNSNNSASGYYAIALGYNTYALGFASVSLSSSTSGGYQSIAIGACESWGELSTALGQAYSYGFESTALGAQCTASGNYSTATGNWASASGQSSIAFGPGSSASSLGSMALGGYTTSSGYYSLAAGFGTQAAAMDSFVVGAYNVGGGSVNSWTPTDPLFEIGNGTSGSPSDAVLVQKNGNMVVQGVVTFAPGGDVPMYTGTN